QASQPVAQRPASVTPNAASKSAGSPDPPLTGTLIGFLAADGVTATYSRTPGETVAGSPYTISATLAPAAVATNYAITYNTAQFTIVNSNLPQISIVPAVTIAEGNAGAHNVGLTVTLSKTYSESVWVSYSTSDGTATAPSDYTRTTGQLQFFPGTTSGTIYVPVIGDTIGEPTETFFVDLSAPINGTLTTATRAVVTITNDHSSLQAYST